MANKDFYSIVNTSYTSGCYTACSKCYGVAIWRMVLDYL